VKRRVIITFDDGYADNYSTVFPILFRAGATATFFVITEKISKHGFMTAAELREMHAAGMSIQSHTASHLPLAVLPDRLVRNELEDSKASLEDVLGAPVSLVSFPHGSYDERVLSLAAEAGYEGCCSSDFQYFKQEANRYCIPRLVVRRGCSETEFLKLLRGDRALLAKAMLMAETRSLVSKMIGVQRYQQLYNAYYGAKRELQ
jgi:peptidoglycan/xylan/chitin deacetylase (PgdA/CDA1 family)